MELVFLHSFEGDLKKLNDKSLMKKLKEIIILFENSNSLSEIDNIKKIRGSKHAFRMRVNDFRLGFLL